MGIHISTRNEFGIVFWESHDSRTIAGESYFKNPGVYIAIKSAVRITVDSKLMQIWPHTQRGAQ